MPLFLILYLGYKIRNRTKVIPLKDIDLDSLSIQHDKHDKHDKTADIGGTAHTAAAHKVQKTEMS